MRSQNRSRGVQGFQGLRGIQWVSGAFQGCYRGVPEGIKGFQSRSKGL